MPPPLAVIWRTWPQILSPFTIWAVLSRLQGGHSFRSCCTPQVRLLPAKVRLTLTGSHRWYLSIFRIHFCTQRVTWWLVDAFFSFLLIWYWFYLSYTPLYIQNIHVWIIASLFSFLGIGSVLIIHFCKYIFHYDM